LGSGSEKVTLFSYDHDDVALDVYFVQKIDGGTVPGVTLTPDASGWTSEAGVAIADTIGPNGEVALVGQLVVRTLAHEIGHYLLNHALPDFTDHRDDDKNLMYWDAVETKRDLDSAQCLEMRSDYAND